MFQRVQSEIEAGALATAVSVLDELSRDRAFDPEYRWEAEWNLSRSLEVHGETEAAYERVNRLLHGAPAAGLRADLRARMAWLQARLSFDARKPQETLALVGLSGGAHRGPAARPWRTTSRARARSCAPRPTLSWGGIEPREETLRKLRADFPSSDAAVYSYIVEADRYAQQDKVIDAERLLTKLADDFPNSPYAAYALYQAALQAERLGTDANLKEAYKLLESLVTNPKYASSDLIFPARMRQGDLLRELNQFPQAQQVYESLVNNPATTQNPDSILAQLALAECHNAQSANDPAHADSAKRIFEDLVERVDATGRRPRRGRLQPGGHPLAHRPRQGAGGVVERRRGRLPREAGRAEGPRAEGALVDRPHAPRRRGRSTSSRAGSRRPSRAWTLLIDSGLPGDALARAAARPLPLARGQALM